MTNTFKNPDPVLTREEAADYIGFKPQTLANWACNNRYDLPFLKLGTRVRYRRSVLDRFLAEMRQQTTFDDSLSESSL